MNKYIWLFLVLVLIGGCMSPLNNDYARPVQEQVTALSTTGWIEDDATATWTYASANAGGNTFTAYRSGDVTETFAPGMRFRAKQGAGYLYFILHAVSSYDAGNDRTTLTFFGGANYDLADAAITDVAYSLVRFPLGFPVGEENWSVEYSDSTTGNQASPVQFTWYNIDSALITLPVGRWKVEYHVCIYVAGSTATNVYVTLSSADNSESNDAWTRGLRVDATGSISAFTSVYASGEIEALSETPYYLNTSTGNSGMAYISNAGGIHPTVITAVSAYY